MIHHDLRKRNLLVRIHVHVAALSGTPKIQSWVPKHDIYEKYTETSPKYALARQQSAFRPLLASTLCAFAWEQHP